MLTLKIANYLHSDRWLLPAMLWLLHGAVMVGVQSPWAEPLLLTHFGLFLLWQPLWRGEQALGRGALLFIGLAATAAVFWLSWWTIAIWLTGLFGLVGARVFALRERRTRLLYLTVTLYVLAVLLLWVVPNLFTTRSVEASPLEIGRTLTWYVMPLLLLVITVLPSNKKSRESAQTVDFIYSLLLFMLLTLVVLGSFAFMTLGGLDYLDALLRTLFLIGLVLLAFGVLWNPRFGFNGLQVMFSRYLLNVGTPFESWLAQLTEAAQHEPDAAAYLRRAVSLLADLPWLSGLSWQSLHNTGQLGSSSEHSVVVEEDGLRLTLFAQQSLNPTLLLHINLLVQLMGYFYQAKQREQSLRDITRLQTVYETGSRLTHDLKNMLQSLLSLTAIAQSREERAQQLLQQQLPLLTQRIEMTLLKLQQPHIENDAPRQALSVWWKTVQSRNQHQLIEWRAPESLPDTNIPSTLFDCVIDNLLDNALRKRQSEPRISILVELKLYPLRLSVCDDGIPIPENITVMLLRGVVVSDNGLGIGLYQAARWAKQLGYGLTLINNRPGSVCFELMTGNGVSPL
jgi:signal transduction histidine kinase